VTVIQASQVAVADLIGHASLVVSQEALKQVEKRAAEEKRS